MRMRACCACGDEDQGFKGAREQGSGDEQHAAIVLEVTSFRSCN
jgi:hypothetical protein